MVSSTSGLFFRTLAELSLSFLIKIVSTGRRNRRLSTKPIAGIVMLFTSAKLKEDYLTERLIEHFKALTQIGHASAVAEHSISTGHNIKWDHFEILASGQCDLQCKIKETLLIRDLKPTLNENVGSENLPGGGGGTWVNFCWVCAAGLSEPLPHYSLFLGQLLTPS